MYLISVSTLKSSALALWVSLWLPISYSIFLPAKQLWGNKLARCIGGEYFSSRTCWSGDFSTPHLLRCIHWSTWMGRGGGNLRAEAWALWPKWCTWKTRDLTPDFSDPEDLIPTVCLHCLAQENVLQSAQKELLPMEEPRPDGNPGTRIRGKDAVGCPCQHPAGAPGRRRATRSLIIQIFLNLRIRITTPVFLLLFTERQSPCAVCWSTAKDVAIPHFLSSCCSSQVPYTAKHRRDPINSLRKSWMTSEMCQKGNDCILIRWGYLNYTFQGKLRFRNRAVLI